MATLTLALLLAAIPTAVLAPPVDRVLVLPFEPAGEGGKAGIAEAVADHLASELDRLGVPAVGHFERLRALQALEVPAVPLSRAAWVRLAEALDISRVVSGTCDVRESAVTFEARWLDVDRGALSAPLVVTAPLADTQTALAQLAWDIALAGPPGAAPVPREAFFSSVRKVPFPAFEAYGLGLAAGQTGARVAHLRRALKLAPDYDKARIALARLAIETRELALVHDALAGVAKTSPLSRSARFHEGVALLEMARYAEAGAVFERLAQAAASPGVLSNQALSALKRGATSQASSLLRQAVDAAPGVADLAFNLGWALLSAGDAEAAEIQLRGVTRSAPRDAYARVVLSWALRKAGRVEEAADEWRGVALLGPPYDRLETPDLSRWLGRVMLSEWPLPIARSDVELAAAHVGRGDALLRAKDLDGALRELARAAYLDPYSARAHELLARAHAARGDQDKAVSELQMSLWCRDDPAVRLSLARVLADLGRLAESRAEAQKVLRAEPGNQAAEALAKP